MATSDYYLIAHGMIVDDQPLAEPRVIATITGDHKLLGPVNPHKILTGIAGRLGVVDFEIVHGDPRHVPGYQPPLPLQGGLYVSRSRKRQR